jgi:hypothetical protein
MRAMPFIYRGHQGNIKLGDVSLFYSCCEVHWALDALKNIMMKIGPNAPALDGLCTWMMQFPPCTLAMRRTLSSF